MGYLTLGILLILITWLVYRHLALNQISKKELLIGWGIKLGFSLIFILVFTQYYSTNGTPYGDVGNFFNDAKVLSEYGKVDAVGYLKILFGLGGNDLALMQTHLAETNIWSYGDNGDLLNDNRLIIRLNSVIHFISFGNIWVHVLIFSFISFLGTTLIYRAFEQYVERKRFFYFALLCAPTFAFWGSGLTKECIFVFGFGITIFYLQKVLLNKLRLVSFVAIIAGISILFFNKPHVGLILVPMLAFTVFSIKRGINWKHIGVYSALIVLTFVIFSYTPPSVNVVTKISNKQQDFMNLGKGGVFFINDTSFCSFDYAELDNFDYSANKQLIKVNEPTSGEYKLFGQDEFLPFDIEASQRAYDVYLVIPPSESYVDVPPIHDSGIQLIKNIPLALVNVLVRPLPTDNGSNFKYIVFLENLAFLLFIVWCIGKRKSLSNEQKGWLFYLVGSAILITLIIGWTTPILGAIARYKMVPQLLLIIASFILLKQKKETT